MTASLAQLIAAGSLSERSFYNLDCMITLYLDCIFQNFTELVTNMIILPVAVMAVHAGAQN
jgi:hypothetical protein